MPDQSRRPWNRLRLAAALVTAAAVFVLTYLAAYVEHPETVAMGNWYTHVMLGSNYKWISRSVEEFIKQNGRYPNSLDELPEGNTWLDPWGRPLQYEQTREGFNIRCLGRDGKPGGVGLDADFDLDDHGGPRIEPTLAQFVFDGEGSDLVFFIALGACFCAGVTYYLAGAEPRRNFSGIICTLAGSSVIIVIALFIATFLVACYLGFLGSGH